MDNLDPHAEVQIGGGFDFVYPSNSDDLVRDAIEIEQNGGYYNSDSDYEVADDDDDLADDYELADDDDDLADDDDDDDELADDDLDDDDEDELTDDEELMSDDEEVQEGSGSSPSVAARIGLAATLAVVTIFSAFMHK